VKELVATGMIDGITTNPTLAASSGIPFTHLITQMCELVEGPVSAEVTAIDAETMIIQGRQLGKNFQKCCGESSFNSRGAEGMSCLNERRHYGKCHFMFYRNPSPLSRKSGGKHLFHLLLVVLMILANPAWNLSMIFELSMTIMDTQQQF
jgi:transaldolase